MIASTRNTIVAAVSLLTVPSDLYVPLAISRLRISGPQDSSIFESAEAGMNSFPASSIGWKSA